MHSGAFITTRITNFATTPVFAMIHSTARIFVAEIESLKVETEDVSYHEQGYCLR
ncbi:hypothetical protein COCNU_contig69297227G000010 [Cocos nucifera]|nr:hypothetical protein [Cocos nucifera]